jgi:hypothetical protein
VHAAVHELDAADANRELGAAPMQGQLTASGDRSAIEQLPRHHDADLGCP